MFRWEHTLRFVVRAESFQETAKKLLRGTNPEYFSRVLEGPGPPTPTAGIDRYPLSPLSSWKHLMLHRFLGHLVCFCIIKKFSFVPGCSPIPFHCFHLMTPQSSTYSMVTETGRSPHSQTLEMVYVYTFVFSNCATISSCDGKSVLQVSELVQDLHAWRKVLVPPWEAKPSPS